MAVGQDWVYAGFWKRFIAFFIDVVVVSIIVFPFAFIIGLVAPDAILVEVPFDLFTTTETISESPEIAEKNADGSTNVVQESIQMDDVLGLWQHHYKVRTVRSNGETENSRTMIDAETGHVMDVTSSGDIEFYVIFIYWILLEASVWQASVGKKIMGLKVTNADGSKPNIFQVCARNLLKILSGITLCVGFMMAGWTARKQALHDKIPNMLVMEVMPDNTATEA